jgi:transposase-like protein
MEEFSFCPHADCIWHQKAPQEGWYSAVGFHQTKAFGPVPRFRCHACGRTFSTQTFSIDYYAKRKVDYERLLLLHGSSQSGRSLSRSFGVSCGTVCNRLDRLSRQAAALQATLRLKANQDEAVCIDGFVSFTRSQFFPSEITISITQDSRFILDFTQATHRRSGSITESQRERARALYASVAFERGSVVRSFRELLDSLAEERPPRLRAPLVLVTDEKREYQSALYAHPLFLFQDEGHRVAQITVNSRLPRTFINPLFASNYLDREIRKDQANHHRESTCFARNVSNSMGRFLCYVVQHNFRKKYLIKAPVSDRRVHAEAAGIAKDLVTAGFDSMLKERAFLSRLQLPPTLERIWRKAYPTPGKEKPDYLPRYALA